MDEKNDDFVLQGTFYNAPEGPTGVSLILNNGCFLQRQIMQIGTHCFLINQAFVGSVGSASGTERPTVLGGGGGGCSWQVRSEDTPACFELPCSRNASRPVHRTPPFAPGFLLCTSLPLGHLQNAHQGAAGQDCLWVTQVRRAGPEPGSAGGGQPPPAPL